MRSFPAFLLAAEFIASYWLWSLIFVSPANRPQHFQRNVSQHSLAQHIACVWTPCYYLLRHVECYKSNKCAWPGATLLNEPGQTTTTSCNIDKCCMKNWTIFKRDPVAHNISQHANDRKVSTQKIARLSTLLQGRNFTVARSHLTRTRREKILSLCLCSPHDRLVVLNYWWVYSPVAYRVV